MMNYNNEYKTYYESLRDKVKSVRLKNEGLNSIENEIIPKKSANQIKGYNGYYRNNRNFNSREINRYGRGKIDINKKIGFIDKMIFRLIGSLFLVLMAFVFKISPNEKVKVVYEKFDSQINKTYDFSADKKKLEKLGIDVGKVEDLIGKIENKTSEILKNIIK